MLLTFAAGLTGILLGLWFRVPALVAAPIATAVVFPLFASFAEFSPLSTAAMIVALLSALQGGYLIGVILRVRGREHAPVASNHTAKAPGSVLSRRENSGRRKAAREHGKIKPDRPSANIEPIVESTPAIPQIA
jgi:hypothetical protein